MKSLPSIILLTLMVFACAERTEAFWDAVSGLVNHPIVSTGLQRLSSKIYGDGRAARSSDVTVVNISSKDFILSSNVCSWGGFSSNMLPDRELPKDTTTKYGVESSGFMTALSCKVKYSSEDGAWFELKVVNPYMGNNKVKEINSRNIRVSHVLGRGNNNEVKFTIKDA